MKMVERSYNTEFFRPKPEILVEEGAGLLIIATPWGSRTGARRAIQAISDFFLMAQGDREVTSPFQWLTCLSKLANMLRTSVMLANDLIYQEDNRNEYTTGVEIFAGAKQGSEFSFVQLGHPQIFHCRKELPHLTAGSVTDLAFDYSKKNNLFSPLPNTLLGAYSTSSLNVRTLRVHQQDKLILLSHSFIPSTFYTLNPFVMTFEKRVTTLIQNQPNQPFWIGELSFSDSI